MPVYEFLCEDCNRVFSFFARNPQAATRKPKCPKCGGKKMTKRFSRFAMAAKGSRSSGPSNGLGDEPGGGGPLSPGDEARMEREMMKLAREMESIDENDPRQLAAAMRRVSEVTGESLGPEMDEAIRRLEAGEDPERIEDELGDLLPDEGMGTGVGGEPSYDDALYDL